MTTLPLSSQQRFSLQRWLAQPAAVALTLAIPFHSGATLAQVGSPAAQTKPNLSETQRQELSQKRRSLEQRSHAGRIAILQEADRCITAAQTREAIKACEQKEQQARQQLRGQLRAEAAQVRAQFGLPPRPERGRNQKPGVAPGQQGV
ncbi:MAG: hypothetical protein WBM08_00040 [Prochlorococcaceae cyanobacterium]